jgi:hypothetical protein
MSKNADVLKMSYNRATESNYITCTGRCGHEPDVHSPKTVAASDHTNTGSNPGGCNTFLIAKTPITVLGTGKLSHRSPPMSDEDKNEWSYTSKYGKSNHSPQCLEGCVQGTATEPCKRTKPLRYLQ